MRGRIITAVLLGALVVTATASADQVPEDCQGNGLRLDIIRDRSVVRVGETAVFSVYASNDGLSACNITDAAIYVEVPGADGNPVGEAQATTLSTGENFSAGASNRLIGKVRAVLNVNADVTDAVVRAFTHGVLHDASTNHDAAIQKTLGTEIARPAIAIAKVGSTAGGPAPQTVTYTYTVKNTTTPTKLADRFTQLANVAPTDDLCQPLS